MSLKQAIAAWDGRSSDSIKHIYQHYAQQPNFIATIIKLGREADSQQGATWLLKAWLESGERLNDKQRKAIFDLLDQLQHWQAKLHILQCLPSLPVNKSDKLKLERFLRDTLIDHNKFVRAWSYNGFYELAKQYPEYREETQQFFDMAMRDEAASVKARIRNIMKTGF